MKKDQYFPHEVSLRQTSEFINLIEKEGIAGYGIYWGLIEFLRSQDNYTGDLRALKNLAKQMRTSTAKILRILNNHDLFEVTDWSFQSVKLNALMKPLESKRTLMNMQSRDSHEITNLRSHRNSLETNTASVTVKKSKGKERKENTSSASAEEVAVAADDADVPLISRKQPWEEYVDELDKEQQWKEIMAMRTGLKMNFMKHYPRIVEYFKNHVRAQGKERSIFSSSDAKSYFCNFLSPGSITYKHLMAQLGTSPEKNNPYRFEERDPANGQRSYCGVPIPDDAPPRPNAQAAWNSQLKQWVF